MKLKTKIKKTNNILSIAGYGLLIAILCSQLFIIKSGTSFAEDNVSKLNQEIENRKNSITELEQKMKLYQNKIKESRTEAVSLQNELSILENEIAKIEIDIKITEQQIQKISLEIQTINLRIKEKEDEIVVQKEKLAKFIRLMHENDQISYLEIILTKKSFSDFFDHYKYVQNIQADLQKTLTKLKNLKADLELQKQSLQEKKTQEEKFKEELKNKSLDLQEIINSRELLLYETQKSERRFQSYVYQLQQEQKQINSDIVSLEKKVREELERRKEAEKFKGFGTPRFEWPVPSRHVTAYFHDPDYPYRYIFEHPAVDIRAPQGTAIKAPEAGYVAQVKDGGKTGYSYIMLIHSDGLSTVYGHVSKILVNTDQYVAKGDTIGLSGGAPGTPGAGNMTTGPHLHFEVRLNGIPVNPLEYLP